jgi:MTH538 TIR-like domain (DUF1863)
MAYRNKTYICFDGDIDMNYYNTLRMWKNNEHIDFTFHNAHEINNINPLNTEATIKRKLRERLSTSKLLIVLIGEKTKNLYRYVRWEIEQALNLDIPIIAVNINKKNGIDTNRCPPILRGRTVVHVPFSKDAIVHATNYWPSHYTETKSKGITDCYYDALEIPTR